MEVFLTSDFKLQELVKNTLSANTLRQCVATFVLKNTLGSDDDKNKTRWFGLVNVSIPSFFV